MGVIISRLRGDGSATLKSVSERWGCGLRASSWRCQPIYRGDQEPHGSFEDKKRRIAEWIERFCAGEVYETTNFPEHVIAYYFQTEDDAAFFRLRWVSRSKP